MERELREEVLRAHRKERHDFYVDTIAQNLEWLSTGDPDGIPLETRNVWHRTIDESIAECKLFGFNPKSVMHEAWERLNPPTESQSPSSDPVGEQP